MTTTSSISDGQVLPKLLEQVSQPIGQVSADGGYDRRTCYEAIAKRGAKAAIPPRRGARIWQHGNSKQERLARDENLRRIRQVGRAKWKRESGYHRRSLAETTMFRLKTIFGSALRGRTEAAQDTETMLRLSALNHPAAGRVLLLTLFVELFFADAPNVGRVAELDARRFACWIIVAFVQAQMLRLLGGRLRPFHNNGVQRQGKQLGVWCVGSADADREGPAIAFDQHTFLDARLATVTGAGADTLILRPLLPMPLPGTPRALPKQPSAACQCQFTP